MLADLALDATLIPAVLAAYLLAGVVKGLTGLGMPAVALGITTLFLDPLLAVTLVLLPVALSNLWQMLRMGQTGAALWRLRWFMGALGLCLPPAALLAADAPEALLMAGMGLMFVLFAAMNLAFRLPPIPPRLDRGAQLAFGALAGVMGGLTALWGPPTAMYLTASGTERDAFIRATGVVFGLGSVPLLAAHVAHGGLDGPHALLSGALVLPTLAGFALGERVRRRMGAERFRQMLIWVFLGLGLNLMRRALTG